MIHFDLPGMKERIDELEDQMKAPDFWNDLERSKVVNRELKTLQNKEELWRETRNRLEDAQLMIELGLEMNDSSVVDEIIIEAAQLEKDVEQMRLNTLLKGPYDANNAIISIHAGAGGTEAMDWASMLLRMYTRWCETSGYEIKTLDILAGEEAGVKSVTLHIIGEYAYGYLKAEKGVHRLVRISPFDSSGRRQPLLPLLTLCRSWRMTISSKFGRKT